MMTKEHVESYREIKNRLVNEFKNVNWNQLNVDMLLKIKDLIESWSNNSKRIVFVNSEDTIAVLIKEKVDE